MNMTVRAQPRWTLMWWLPCVLALSACATTLPRATPAVCPKPPPAPANVMRAPSYEQRLRKLVRIGRDADDQLRACQAVIELDRR